MYNPWQLKKALAWCFHVSAWETRKADTYIHTGLQYQKILRYLVSLDMKL